MKYLNAIRHNEWWENKLCPLLAVGYATLIINDSSFLQAGIYFLFLLSCMAAGAIYVCFINDIADIKEDLACGKPNRMAGFSPKVRGLLLAAILFVLALIFIYFLLTDPLSTVLSSMAWVAFTLYSIEPFRLKRRGFLGVLADASGSHLFPSLFFIAAITHFTGQVINWYWFCAVGVWALCYGIRGILWHQCRDRENDISVGLTTFVASMDMNDFKIREKFIFLLEIAALSVMIILIGKPWTVLFLIIYIFTVFIRYKVIDQPIIIIQTPPSNYSQMLMMDYYQVFLPLSLLIVATVQQVNIFFLLIIHIILFPKRLWGIIKDMFISFRILIAQKT